MPTVPRQGSQSYRAIDGQTRQVPFLRSLPRDAAKKNHTKEKPGPKHFEFRGTLNLQFKFKPHFQIIFKRSTYLNKVHFKQIPFPFDILEIP